MSLKVKNTELGARTSFITGRLCKRSLTNIGLFKIAVQCVMAGELFSDPSVIRSTILCHTKTLDTAGADSDVEFERQKSEMCQGSHG